VIRKPAPHRSRASARRKLTERFVLHPLRRQRSPSECDSAMIACVIASRLVELEDVDEALVDFTHAIEARGYEGGNSRGRSRRTV